MSDETKEIKLESQGWTRRKIFDTAALTSLGVAATALTMERARAQEPEKHETKKVEDLEDFKYDLEKQTH
jgi:hypothetical protein